MHVEKLEKRDDKENRASQGKQTTRRVSCFPISPWPRHIGVQTKKGALAKSDASANAVTDAIADARTPMCTYSRAHTDTNAGAIVGVDAFTHPCADGRAHRGRRQRSRRCPNPQPGIARWGFQAELFVTLRLVPPIVGEGGCEGQM